jgi:hypothetical protein
MGHPQAKDLLMENVYVQEKIDGSQFSFGLINGEVLIKSKGANIVPDAPPTMFKTAVETVLRLHAEGLLTPEWTYRGEVLNHPKHNVLAYDRVPDGNIILFDISDDYESFLPPTAVHCQAGRLGLEAVPTFFYGKVTSSEQVLEFLDKVSVLGGQKIEGVVIKNYFRHGIDGKQLMGKYVSEAFKEVHTGEWKKANPTRNDIIDAIAGDLRTPARWAKAVQHLRDRGELTESPKDIGSLIKEVIDDVKTEEEAAIKERLFKYAWKIIGRVIVSGLPEWYKEQLLEKQFVPTEVTTTE